MNLEFWSPFLMVAMVGVFVAFIVTIIFTIKNEAPVEEKPEPRQTPGGVEFDPPAPKPHEYEFELERTISGPFPYDYTYYAWIRRKNKPLQTVLEVFYSETQALQWLDDQAYFLGGQVPIKRTIR